MSEPPAAHPMWQALYEHAAARPGAVEDHPWGEVVFKVRDKIFVFLGSGERPVITVKPRPEDREGLLALPFVEVAPYVGRYGWVTLTVEDEPALDLARELIDVSHARLAPRPRPARKE